MASSSADLRRAACVPLSKGDHSHLKPPRGARLQLVVKRMRACSSGRPNSDSTCR